MTKLQMLKQMEKMLNDNAEYITDLEKKIEKMKCCNNCKHFHNCPYCKDDFFDCKNNEHWELASN